MMINKIGTNLKDIETPELIIDLDILDANVNTVSKAYSDSHLKMRAHTKNLKSP